MANEKEEAALHTPPMWYDPYWREKIEIAKQERASAQRANDRAKKERQDKAAKGKGRRLKRHGRLTRRSFAVAPPESKQPILVTD